MSISYESIAQSKELGSTFPLDDIMDMFIKAQTREEKKEAKALFNTTVHYAKHFDGGAVRELLDLKENSYARALFEQTYKLPGGSVAEKNRLATHFNSHITDNY
jgi:hypothetical protein